MRISTPKLIAAGIVAGMLVVGAGLGLAQEKKAPFGDKASLDYAQKLWAAMQRDRLVGDRMWVSTPHETNPPHGAWVSVIDGQIQVDGNWHKIIVKYNYGGKDIDGDKLQNDPAKYLAAITVMLRREAGYDPENKNWYWAKYLPDGKLDKNPKGMSLAGRVAKGATVGCIACHSKAPGGDYIYLNNREK